MSTNNAAHTPGPWHGKKADGKYEMANDWRVEHESADTCESAPICDKRGVVIAFVVHSQDSYYSGSHPRIEANACLIATAPELLDFAKTIGAAYPNDPGTSDLDNEQPVTITLRDVRRAWSLIAKAQGGAK